MAIEIVYKTDKGTTSFGNIEPGQFFVDEIWSPDKGRLFQRLQDGNKSERCAFVSVETGHFWTSVYSEVGNAIPVDVIVTVSPR